MSVASRRGVPLVVSAPSGAGKTTLCRRVMAMLPGVEFSVSHTTRPLRGSERDGVDYHFVDDARFDRMVAAGEFLEWAHVHARRYGTSRQEAEGRLPRGVDVLFDIDVQGGRQIATALPEAVLVFVLPPDLTTLEQRLRGRGSDSEEQVQRRLRVAREEIDQAVPLYTHWIVNDVLERAVDELRSIIVAERLKRVAPAELVGAVLQSRGRP
jgi:guanylate kinase